MASLKAMQTMQTQMAAQVTQVTELIAGLSGYFEGERSSQGPSTKEVRGELGSYVAIIGTLAYQVTLDRRLLLHFCRAESIW